MVLHVFDGFAVAGDSFRSVSAPAVILLLRGELTRCIQPQDLSDEIVEVLQTVNVLPRQQPSVLAGYGVMNLASELVLYARIPCQDVARPNQGSDGSLMTCDNKGEELGTSAHVDDELVAFSGAFSCERRGTNLVYNFFLRQFILGSFERLPFLQDKCQ